MDILSALRALINREKVAAAVFVQVTAVDVAAGTCDVTPLDGSAPILDVRLQAVIPDNGNIEQKGVLIVPKVGSTALCGIIENNPALGFLTLCTEIEALELRMDSYKLRLEGERIHLNYGNSDISILITESGIELNGGTLGGLVKLYELQTELNKMKAFLETLRNSFNAFVPVPGDGGAALKTVMAAALNPLDTGNFSSNLENTKIKQ